MLKIEVVETIRGGPYIIAGADAANDDWIRAARLMDKADAGDDAAAAELDRLFNTPSEGALIE